MSPARLCPGIGKPCGIFMSSLTRDPHPLCKRCRGQDCTRLLTCDVCVNWTDAQWKEFEKKRKKKSKSHSLGTVGTSVASTAHSSTPSAESFAGFTPDGGATAGPSGVLGTGVSVEPRVVPEAPSRGGEGVAPTLVSATLIPPPGWGPVLSAVVHPPTEPRANEAGLLAGPSRSGVVSYSTASVSGSPATGAVERRGEPTVPARSDSRERSRSRERERADPCCW